MIKGVEKMRSFIEQNNCPLWTIRRTEKSAPVYSSEALIVDGNKREGTLPSVAEALNFFDTIVPSLENGFYFIECYNNVSTKNENRYKISCQIGNDAFAQHTNAIGSLQQGLYTQAQVEEKISATIAKLESERIIRELQSKVSALEAEKPDNFDMFISKIAPYTDKILSGIFGTQAQPMAAIGNTTTQKSNDMQQELKDRLYKAINNWNNAEPDMVEMVEKIATMAANKDTMYMMVKSNLLKK